MAYAARATQHAHSTALTSVPACAPPRLIASYRPDAMPVLPIRPVSMLWYVLYAAAPARGVCRGLGQREVARRSAAALQAMPGTCRSASQATPSHGYHACMMPLLVL